MPRGVRTDTIQRIQLARSKSPMSLGPLLGELSITLNVPASVVSTITKAHEQTVLRWFFGQSEMQPQWIKASLRLFGVLTWMHTSKIQPLSGDTNAKITELTRHLKLFEKLATVAS